MRMGNTDAGLIRNHVDPSSILYADELLSYNRAYRQARWERSPPQAHRVRGGRYMPTATSFSSQRDETGCDAMVWQIERSSCDPSCGFVGGRNG